MVAVAASPHPFHVSKKESQHREQAADGQTPHPAGRKCLDRGTCRIEIAVKVVLNVYRFSL
jgi:hypothetical protein